MKRNVPQGALAAIVAAVTTLAVMIGFQPGYLPASQGPAFLETTGTYSGLQAANRLNGAIDALLTCNKGPSAPTNAISGSAEAGQCWIDDTSATMLIKKRYTGSAWVVEGVLDVANGVWAPPSGGGSATVNSATTTDLCAAPATLQTVNGTTTITGFGSSCVQGVKKILVFQGALTITYNVSSLIIPGQRNYLTSAGDVAEAVYLGSGNWRLTSISKIDGNAVLSPAFRVGTIYTTFEEIDSKAVHAYGQALSRATHPDYFNAVTRVRSGTLTSGGVFVTGVTGTAGLGNGMPIEGTGIQPGTLIAAIAGTTIQMSQSATVNGTQSIRIFPTGYGAGGDTTTVGVPNCEGKKIAGRTNMSGTDSGTLTAATLLNTTVGTKTSTLGIGNLPPFTPPDGSFSSVSVTWGVNGLPVAVGNLSSPLSNLGGTGNVHNYVINDGGGGSVSVTNGTVSGPVTMTSTSAIGMSAVPVAVVDPTLIAECAMRVLP